jgi:hypothetical protein
MLLLDFKVDAGYLTGLNGDAQEATAAQPVRS